MDVRILIETEFDNGDVRRHDLGRLSRPKGMICVEGIGLMLENAREILKRLQAAIVVDQIEEISRSSLVCPGCQTLRRIHDYRTRRLDTLFGRICESASPIDPAPIWKFNNLWCRSALEPHADSHRRRQ